MNAIKKNTEALIDVGKEVGLEVNTQKSRHQNAGRNHNVDPSKMWRSSNISERQYRTKTLFIGN
jgi:hypothetical protein